MARFDEFMEAIRNAGGRVSDNAVRSLVISERLLGTNEIVVIHHTENGRISSSWTVSDALGLMRQLGLTPQPEDSS